MIPDDVLEKFHLSRDKTRVKLYKNITGNDLLYLKQLPKLEGVTFHHGGVVNAAVLAGLAGLNVQYLKIGRWNRCKDSDLAPLKLLKKLETLNLSCGHEMTGAAFTHLRDLESLTYLHLYCNKYIADAEMASLGSLRNLKRLSLRCGENMTDKGLDFLRNLTSLERLDIDSNSKITGESLSQLERLKQLTTVRISGNWTDAGIANLARLPQLKYLNVTTGRRITGAPIASLVEMPDLSFTITDEAGHVLYSRHQDYPCDEPGEERSLEMPADENIVTEATTGSTNSSDFLKSVLKYFG